MIARLLLTTALVALLLPAEGRRSQAEPARDMSVPNAQWLAGALAHPRLLGPTPASEPPEHFLCWHRNLHVLQPELPFLQRLYRYATRNDRANANAAAPYGVYGFAPLGNGHRPCVVTILRGTPPNSTLFRHELAHCCGWADHEGAESSTDDHTPCQRLQWRKATGLLVNPQDLEAACGSEHQ